MSQYQSNVVCVVPGMVQSLNVVRYLTSSSSITLRWRDPASFSGSIGFRILVVDLAGEKKNEIELLASDLQRDPEGYYLSVVGNLLSYVEYEFTVIAFNVEERLFGLPSTPVVEVTRVGRANRSSCFQK